MPGGGVVTFIIVGDVSAEPPPPAPTGAVRIYMSADGGVWKSVDSGLHWSLIYAREFGGSIPTNWPISVIPGSGGNDLILVPDIEGTTGNDQAFFAYSSDGGVNWVTSNAPWAPVIGSTNWFRNVGLASATEWLVGRESFGGDYRSTDGGANWTALPAIGFGYEGLDSAQFGKIWLSSGGTDGEGPARSDTDGTNVEDYAGAGGDNINRQYGISAACGAYLDSNSRTTKLGIHNGSIVTFTGDISPTGSGSLSDSGFATGAIWTTDDGTTLYLWVPGIGTGQFWTSTNGGSSWTKVADHADLDGFADRRRGIQIDPLDPNTIYLVTGIDNNVLISTDGGANWTIKTVPSAKFPNQLWVATG